MRILKITLAALCLLLFAAMPGIAQQTYTNSIGIEFVLIPAGSFRVETGKNNVAESVFGIRIIVSKPFYLGKYEVTQEQWLAVMGGTESNPSTLSGRTHPMENVSWDDAQEFIKSLNAKEGHNRYRLPSEAEWEYAARAGTETAYSFGDDANELSQYGWYRDNSGDKTLPVGQKQPNAWGLYDVHGNVWEWVQDWYGGEYYSNSPGADPKGSGSGKYRLNRGGGWFSNAERCRSAYRFWNTPDGRNGDVGFRLALSAE